MGAGHFVGRVGALAVALGVGAAVSSGCTVARADETTGAHSPNLASAGDASGGTSGSSDGPASADRSGSSATGSSSSEPGDNTHDGDTASPSGHTSTERDAGSPPSSSKSTAGSDDADEPSDSAAATDTAHDSAAEPSTTGSTVESAPTPTGPTEPSTTATQDSSAAHRSGSASDSTSEKPEQPSNTSDVVDLGGAKPDPSGTSGAAETAPVPSSTPSNEVQAMVVDTKASLTAEAPAIDATASFTAAASDAQPTASTADMAMAVATSLLGTTAPGDTPVDSPAEWVLLAAARRELAELGEGQTAPSNQISTSQSNEAGARPIESIAAQSVSVSSTTTADPLQEAVTGAFRTITNILSTAVTVVDDAITGALGFLSGAIHLSVSLGSLVLTTAVNVVNWGITTATSLITGALTATASALADAFDSTPTPLGDAIASTLTFLTQTVTTTMTILSEAVADTLGFAGTGVTTAITILSDTVTTTLDIATQAIDTAFKTVNAILTPDAPPVAAGDALITAEDTALVIAAATLRANDTDPDDDTLTITGVTQAGHGTTVLNADGTITYIPTANYNGHDSFTYTVSDGTLSATATVTLTITRVNDNPIAGADAATTPANTTLILDPNSLLSNDSDPDSDALSISSVGAPGHGSTILNADGTITYTPAGDYTGTDSFTYTITDGTAQTSAAVNVTVTAVTPPGEDSPPVAVDDRLATDEDTPLTIDPNQLLANDYDPDSSSGPLTLTIAATPSHGGVQANTDGTFTYTPEDNFNGTDTFTYVASNTATSNVATVTIAVTAVNDLPTLHPDAPTTDTVSGAVTVNLHAVDLDGDTLSYQSSTPALGGITFANGAFTYTPTDAARAAAAVGGSTTDAVTVTVTDPNGGSVSQDFTVAVIPLAGHATTPTAVDDSLTTAEDTPLIINPTALLANDTDSGHTVTVVEAPNHGSLSTNVDGNFTYTPATNFNGTDVFTYVASNGTVNSNSANVTITVTPVNDAPTNGIIDIGTPDASTGVVIGTVSATDLDGDALTYAAPAATDKGSITLAGNVFTYTPTEAARHAAAATDASDSDQHDLFTVTASDRKDGTLAIHVSVVVNGENSPPDNGAFLGSVIPNYAEGVVLSLVSASDSDGDSLTYSIGTPPSKGTASVELYTAAGIIIRYTPTKAARLQAASDTATDDDRQDAFSITASDGHGGTISIPVTVEVVAAVGNRPPQATAIGGYPGYGSYPGYAIDSYDPTTSEIRGHLTMSDPDGDPMIFASTTDGLTVDEAGNFTFVPPDYVRIDAYLAPGIPMLSTEIDIDVSDGELTTTVHGLVPVSGIPPKAPPTVGDIPAHWEDPAISIISTNETNLGPGGGLRGFVRSDDRVYYIDQSNAVVLSPDGSRVFTRVVYTDPDTKVPYAAVQVADAVTNSVIATITTDVAYNPGGAIAISPDGRYIYSVGMVYDDWEYEYTGGALKIIDTHTNSIVDTVLLNENTHRTYDIAVSPNGSRVYLRASSDNDSVIVVDTSSDSVISTINVDLGDSDGLSGGMAVSPDGNFLYVRGYTVTPTTGQTQAKIAVVDTRSGEVSYTLPTGVSYVSYHTPNYSQVGNGIDMSYGRMITISPDGRHLYTRDFYRDANGKDIAAVTVIDAATGQITVIPTFDEFRAGGLVSGNGRLYVLGDALNIFGGTDQVVHVIDTQINTIINDIPISPGTGGIMNTDIAASSTGGRVYVRTSFPVNGSGELNRLAAIAVIDPSKAAISDSDDDPDADHATPSSIAGLFRRLVDKTKDTSEGIYIETTRTNAGTELIVYIGGTDADKRGAIRHFGGSLDLDSGTNQPMLENIDSFIYRNTKPEQLAIIDQYVSQNPGSKILLVGYSQGGMDAQNIAASGRYAGVSTVITFGSPIVRPENSKYNTIHLWDPRDNIARLTFLPAALVSNLDKVGSLVNADVINYLLSGSPDYKRYYQDALASNELFVSHIDPDEYQNILLLDPKNSDLENYADAAFLIQAAWDAFANHNDFTFNDWWYVHGGTPQTYIDVANAFVNYIKYASDGQEKYGAANRDIKNYLGKTFYKPGYQWSDEYGWIAVGTY